MIKPGALTIGGLAKRENVNRQTIRYYERRGLIAESSRTASGYRLYGDDAARRLAFIRRAKQLGFSLNEIEGLLALRMHPDTTCGEVRTKARQNQVGRRKNRRAATYSRRACEIRSGVPDKAIYDGLPNP